MPIQPPSALESKPTRPNVGDANVNGLWARYLSATLGAWLLISALSLQQGASVQTNTWIAGSLICVMSLAAIAKSAVRWATAALSVWLFVSTLLLPDSSFVTSWHNTVIAVLVFVLSLVPNAGVLGTGTGPPKVRT